MLVIALLTLSLTTQAQTIRYVKPGASGTGTTWANASGDLQAMINISGVQEVWVAAGTYKPGGNANTDRTISFRMKNGVTIYGGFAATGTPTFAQRNPTSFTTVLSGDIGTLNNTTDNSYHVVNNDQTNIDNTAVLDGFVIRGGNANGEGNDVAGGGIINVLTSPTIRNCIIQGNSASLSGGAMYNYSANPRLTNCSFQSNTANREGGAMHNDGSNPVLANCSFQGNTATSTGGAINNSSSSPSLTNCSFQSNTATNGGGAMANSFNSNPSLTNCSFQGNTAPNGGVINNGFNGTNSASLTNCVLFGNGGDNTFATIDNRTVTLRYCLIENLETGFTDGGNNLTTAISPFTSTTSTQLNGCTPAINAGSNMAYTSVNGPATDLAGNTRVFGGTIDMGAYEFQAAPNPDLIVTNPTVTTANQGVPFSASFTASGGVSPYSFRLASGTLPANLSLSATGEVNDTPTQTGSFSVTVRATDALGCSGVGATYTLNIREFIALTRYVKPVATGTGSGDSWANASGDLQAMINLPAVTQVWVAAGTYKPGGNANTDRTVSFRMKNGVAIYGGFVGNESSVSQRPAVNPVTGQPSRSILSGEIGDLTSIEDNSLHVIDNPPGLTQSALLDGFVITRGYGSNTVGGGVQNRGNGSGQLCSPTFQNCLFLENAANGGAGMCNNAADGGNSSPVLTNCVFQNNTGLNYYGGGILNSVYNGGTTNVRISNSLFINNFNLFGGGIANENGGTTTLDLTNCSFIGNRSNNNGGALYTYQGGHSFTITNCSFQNNIAGYGNAIYTSGNVTLTNSVIFNNGALNQQPIVVGGLTATYTLSDVTLAGAGNILTTISPFVSTTSTQLNSSSPAINAGSNTAYASVNGPATDLAGNARVFGGTIDMGAYEYQAPAGLVVTNPTVTTANQSSPFSASFTVSGGTDPYSFSLASGTLPAGLSLSAAGVLSGTPTQAGSFSITVRATDANSYSGVSATYTLAINSSAPFLAGFGASPGTVCVGSPVTFTATVSNVTGNYSYTLTNGSSPLTGTSSGALFSRVVTATVTGGQSFSLLVSSNGQVAGSTTNVTVSVAPSLSLTNSGPLSSTNTSVTLTASTGFASYVFSSGASQPGGPSSNTAQVSAVGVYSVTATTSAGCSATATTTVTSGVSSPTVCRGGTAVISVAVSGNPVKYEWYKNSLSTPKIMETPQLFRGTATSSLTIINAQTNTQGDFYLKVTDGAGSVVVYGPYRLVVDASCRAREVAAAEPEFALAVELAPNPIAGDRLRAVVRGAEGRSLAVSLVDLRGRLVRQQIWSVAGPAEELDWELAGQPGGTYVLEVISGSGSGGVGQRRSVKVIKP
ncbi:hypothetical protein GCM10027341_08390 [Spirosoma knui]